MELKFNELDDNDVEDIGYFENNTFVPSNPPNLVKQNPYNTRPQIMKPVINSTIKEKKSVSYDDILSSLNVQVVNGVLQIKRADKGVEDPKKAANKNIGNQLNVQAQTKRVSFNPQLNNYNYMQNQSAVPQHYNLPPPRVQPQVQPQSMLQQQQQNQAQKPVSQLTPEEKQQRMALFLKQQEDLKKFRETRSRKMTFF
jgi:hypothetical protein